MVPKKLPEKNFDDGEEERHFFAILALL